MVDPAGMELLLLGVCGAAGTDDKPLMMIDPAYTNYISFAERVGRKTVTVQRHLGKTASSAFQSWTKLKKPLKSTILEHFL